MDSPDERRNGKRVFHTLDGFRGIAAICVALHHLAGWPIGLRDFFPQAGLAVDMFFAISGFVLAHSYQTRFDAGMPVGKFMRGRIIRLFPLYILGSSIKLSSIIFLTFSHGGKVFSGKLIASCAFAILFIPTPPSLSINGAPFPFDGPAWSLFFELAVNLLWVLILRRSRTLTLLSICLLAGSSLAYIGVNLEAFALGAPRVIFSFFAGVLIYKAWCRWPSKFQHSNIILILISTVVIGVLSAAVNQKNLELFNLIVIGCVPILIFIIAKIEVDRILRSWMTIIGAASYAIYALHDPLFYVLENTNILNAMAPLRGLIIAGLTLFFLTGLSLYLDKVFDRPIRQWLEKNLASGFRSDIPCQSPISHLP